jgi:hypothetical protein
MNLISKILTYTIALVWIANGLFCKVLNFVPRHEMIVGSILGGTYAPILTKIIGLSEICMAIWILSGIKSRLCAWAQMSIVATMNILELILVPDLLLWGEFNAVFALIFILLVFYAEFVAKKE